jgi:hypothetical protein
VRANRATGELEVEGTPQLVGEWWEKIWPQLADGTASKATVASVAPHRAAISIMPAGELPEVFGEFFNDFSSDVSDVDKMLIAGAFVQGKDPDRAFTTKAANQLLIDQNIKVTNASECVRRLIQTKRAFVVGEGKFRVSAQGFDHLNTLKAQPAEHSA